MFPQSLPGVNFQGRVMSNTLEHCQGWPKNKNRSMKKVVWDFPEQSGCCPEDSVVSPWRLGAHPWQRGWAFPVFSLPCPHNRRERLRQDITAARAECGERTLFWETNRKLCLPRGHMVPSSPHPRNQFVCSAPGSNLSCPMGRIPDTHAGQAQTSRGHHLPP